MLRPSFVGFILLLGGLSVFAQPPADLAPVEQTLRLELPPAALRGEVAISIVVPEKEQVLWVVLFVDGQFDCMQNYPPYVLRRDTRRWANGTHKLQARAVLADNRTIESPPVTVTVINPAGRPLRARPDRAPHRDSVVGCYVDRPELLYVRVQEADFRDVVRLLARCSGREIAVDARAPEGPRKSLGGTGATERRSPVARRGMGPGLGGGRQDLYSAGEGRLIGRKPGTGP